MTRMSEHHATSDRDFGAKSSGSLKGSRLARAVHEMGVPVGVMLSLLVAGCVIPPSLSVDNQDAGANSPPSITAVRAADKEYFEGDPNNPVIFTVLVQGQTLNVSMLDTDLTDTLFVRVFVNYTLMNPTGERGSCTAAPSGTSPKRSCTVDTSAVCITDDAGKTLNMTVVAFDRQPLDAGTPPHQAMPEGGLSTSKFFFLNCQAP